MEEIRNLDDLSDIEIGDQIKIRQCPTGVFIGFGRGDGERTRGH